MLTAVNLLRFLDISRSRAPSAWIGGVLVVGILLSIGLFAATRGWQQRELNERATAVANEQIEKLHISILRSMEVLHSIASLHRLNGRIERGAFRQFVQGALERQPELQAVSWNPIIAAEDRARLESAARADGLDRFSFREQSGGGLLVTAGIRASYTPVYLIEPMEGNAEALGYDLNSDEFRRRTLEQARDSGQPVATAPIRLTQTPSDHAGFLVVLPVYQKDSPAPASTAERRQQVSGFAVAVFKVADLVGESFRELRRKGIVASLFDLSPGGERLYGAPKEALGSVAWLDVAGRPWAVSFAPASEFSSGVAHWQSWLVLTSGLAFTLLSTAYLYFGWRRTQEIALANASLQEEVITRQRAEAEAAAANQAKSDFLASMSHEIRTPLNAILGYAQLMQRDRHLSPEQRDSARGISTGGHHLLGLINEILDLSKIEAGRMDLNPVDFDLGELGRDLATTFKPLCAEKRIGFRLELGFNGTRQVRGDEGKLRQVLINLLGNAVKFTSAGEVVLGLRSETEGSCSFEVIDTGLGIPPEELPHIFKPFHQGSGAQHQGGTGLGLTIAQRQVELLGGTLELESERGVGSRFHFRIPLAATTSPLPEASPRVERLAPGECVRALIVDDRPENRDVLGRMLSTIGCQVTFASDGREAIVAARESRPHLILLDLLLPGMPGTEVARELLADPATRSAKIVMHTASALPRHREESMASGCVDFLSKPFQCEKLYACLSTHLGVRFQYAPAVSGEPELTQDIPRISLPDWLCAKLEVAAELHSTTALKAALQELRSMGPGAEQLAEHIRQLMRSYDMNGIQLLLARVVVPAPSS